MRRFGVTFYFSFAALAQLITLHSLQHFKHRLPPRIQILGRWQLALVALQWCLGLTSVGITIAEPAYKYEADNILEWNFALAMVAFYGVSGVMWWKRPPAVTRAA